MKNDDYPGEMHHYGRKNLWKVATLVLFISTIVFATTTLLAYNRIIGPTTQAARPTSIATQQTTTVPTNETPTSASTLSSPSTVQPSATVADGTITENITLTCGGCNDPIHVTLNTIQIDTANGRMIWDNTLKDVTSSGNRFNFNEYNLQASTSQTPVQATLSQPQSSGSNQEDIQAIFAFVPFHNVTYTLSVIVYTENGGGVVNGTITFDSVKITF